MMVVLPMYPRTLTVTSPMWRSIVFSVLGRTTMSVRRGMVSWRLVSLIETECYSIQQADLLIRLCCLFMGFICAISVAADFVQDSAHLIIGVLVVDLFAGQSDELMVHVVNPGLVIR